MAFYFGILNEHIINTLLIALTEKAFYVKITLPYLTKRIDTDGLQK